MLSYIIGFVIVAFGLFVLIKSVKKEVTDGCYACPSKSSCSKSKCNSYGSVNCDTCKGDK
ncbi:MAG: hypothetical protein WBH44_00030 [Proteocatella sp.]